MNGLDLIALWLGRILLAGSGIITALLAFYWLLCWATNATAHALGLHATLLDWVYHHKEFKAWRRR